MAIQKAIEAGDASPDDLEDPIDFNKKIDVPTCQSSQFKWKKDSLLQIYQNYDFSDVRNAEDVQTQGKEQLESDEECFALLDYSIPGRRKINVRDPFYEGLPHDIAERRYHGVHEEIIYPEEEDDKECEACSCYEDEDDEECDPCSQKSSISCGQSASPCGQSASPCGQSASPCGQSASPCGQSASPCGQSASPCGQSASPCGQSASPCGQNASPYSQSDSPCGPSNQSDNPCGQKASSYNQSDSPCGQRASSAHQVTNGRNRNSSSCNQSTSPCNASKSDISVFGGDERRVGSKPKRDLNRSNSCDMKPMSEPSVMACSNQPLQLPVYSDHHQKATEDVCSCEPPSDRSPVWKEQSACSSPPEVKPDMKRRKAKNKPTCQKPGFTCRVNIPATTTCKPASSCKPKLPVPVENPCLHKSCKPPMKIPIEPMKLQTLCPAPLPSPRRGRAPANSHASKEPCLQRALSVTKQEPSNTCSCNVCKPRPTAAMSPEPKAMDTCSCGDCRSKQKEVTTYKPKQEDSDVLLCNSCKTSDTETTKSRSMKVDSCSCEACNEDRGMSSIRTESGLSAQWHGSGISSSCENQIIQKENELYSTPLQPIAPDFVPQRKEEFHQNFRSNDVGLVQEQCPPHMGNRTGQQPHERQQAGIQGKADNLQLPPHMEYGPQPNYYNPPPMHTNCNQNDTQNYQDPQFLQQNSKSQRRCNISFTESSRHL